MVQAPGCPCECPDAGCPVTFLVKGCGGRVLPGATVSVAGGPSGVTDSGGFVTLGITAVGIRNVTASRARFTSATVSRNLQCGFEIDISLTPAAGYRCTSMCALPFAETLHTDLAAPDDVLAWNGTQWVTDDGGGDHKIQLDTSGGLILDVSFCGTPGTPTIVVLTCPPSLLIELHCPVTFGGGGGGVIGHVTE